MPSFILEISEAELEKLRYERYAYPCPMIQKRIYAVWLKATTGWSNATIGQIVGLHFNAVGKWINTYRQSGYTALLSNHYGGRNSALEAQADSLLQSFKDDPPLTAGQAADRIKASTGLQRSTQQVRSFMRRHGLKYMKCGHLPAKADRNAQQVWVATALQPVIAAAEKGEVHLLFSDAAHFVLAPFLCRLWCMVRVFIKTAAGRNRINVLGAVHAITKEVYTTPHFSDRRIR